MEPSIFYTWMESPTGKLLLAADEARLRHIIFADGREPAVPGPNWREGRNAAARDDPATAGLVRGRVARVQSSPRARRSGLPSARLARTVQHPVWRNDLLRRARAAHRIAQRFPRGRPRQRREPDSHRDSLPSRHRKQRQAHRLRRRPSPEGVSAGTGTETALPCR